MSITGYRSNLRSNARRLWGGLCRDDEFQTLMFDTIDRWLQKAWIDGMKQVGLSWEEITPDEQLKLSAIVFREYSHVPKLTAFILANSKAAKGKLGTVFARLEGWLTRYTEVVNQAILSGRDDPKLEWRWTPGKEHCSTCKKLNGKVKRASVWKASGWAPQSRALA